MSRLLLKNALYVNRFNTSLLIKLFQDNQRIIQKCSECGVEVNYTVRFFEKIKFCRTCAMAKKANIPTLHSYITAENATIIGNNVECKCKKCGNIELSTKTRFRQKIQRWNKFLCTSCIKAITTENISKFHKGKKFTTEQLEKSKAALMTTILEKYGSYENYRRHKSEKGKEIAATRNKEYYDNRLIKTRKTCMEKYGVTNVMKCKAIADKLRESCSKIDKTKITEKRNNTLIKKYGSLEEYRRVIGEKIKQTNLEKYGFEYTFQVPEVKKKIALTNLSRYGTENPAASFKIKNKIKAIFLFKYGVVNPFMLDFVKDKIKQTCLERYGVEYYGQTSLYSKVVHKKYIYDNIMFDSSWELAFYIYCTDNNILITRAEDNKFLYTTSDNKIHTYTPDFIINKTDIIEIKGSHLFNENGTLGMLGDERDLKKFELIKSNNITLIGQNKIKFYMDYINKNYGREYLNTFKKF